MTQSLAELEQLCNVLYNSHNQNERAHAEGVLRPFSTNAEYIPQCKVR
jgi:exportin-7